MKNRVKMPSINPQEGTNVCPGLIFFINGWESTGSNEILNLKLLYPPSVNEIYSHVGRKRFVNKDGKNFYNYINKVFYLFNYPRFEDAKLEAILNLYPKDRRRRDLDNPQKILFDSFKKVGLYNDDTQIKKCTTIMNDPNASLPQPYIEIAIFRLTT